MHEGGNPFGYESTNEEGNVLEYLLKEILFIIYHLSLLTSRSISAASKR